MTHFSFPKEKMDELGVAGVFLFGSRAQGAAGEKSDFDVAVLMRDRRRLSDRASRKSVYNALYDLLASQIQRICDIDIVFIEDADLQFRYHVARDGELLYSGDDAAVAGFLERTIEEYADFAPFRRQFHEALLERI